MLNSNFKPGKFDSQFIIKVLLNFKKHKGRTQGRNQTQHVGRAQHEPTYNGPIYLYRLSILNGSAQQIFSICLWAGDH